MATITIAQRMSETGTILDLSSTNYDITVDLGTRYQYAVGGPSYYNLDWTRHTSLAAALRRVRELRGYEGITLLRADGMQADISYGGQDVDRWNPCNEVTVE